MTALDWADSLVKLAGNSCHSVKASNDNHPGILVRIELHIEFMQ
jgi:acyl-coenzyme A thioesterase PaaI-like protein